MSRDHTTCCGPESAFEARRWMLSNGPHQHLAYQWRTQLRERGFVLLHRGGVLAADNARNDAVLAEARDTSFWVRWDGPHWINGQWDHRVEGTSE